MAEDGTHLHTLSLVPPREVGTTRCPIPPTLPFLRMSMDGQPPGVASHANPHTWHPGPSGGLVAESDVDPPGPIPNPVVTHVSAGEYCGSCPWEARPLRAPQTARNTRPDKYLDAGWSSGSSLGS